MGKKAAKKTAKKFSTKVATRKAAAASARDVSTLIDGRIAELGDWRGEMLSRIRKLAKAVDASVVESWKWRGVPVFEREGILFTGETYKNVVKLTFAKGAQLRDPKKLFNAGLEGNTRRAIDIHEGEKVDEAALKKLIADAIALNMTSKSRANTTH